MPRKGSVKRSGVRALDERRRIADVERQRSRSRHDVPTSTSAPRRPISPTSRWPAICSFGATPNGVRVGRRPPGRTVANRPGTTVTETFGDPDDLAPLVAANGDLVYLCSLRAYFRVPGARPGHGGRGRRSRRGSTSLVLCRRRNNAALVEFGQRNGPARCHRRGTRRDDPTRSRHRHRVVVRRR